MTKLSIMNLPRYRHQTLADLMRYRLEIVAPVIVILIKCTVIVTPLTSFVKIMRHITIISALMVVGCSAQGFESGSVYKSPPTKISAVLSNVSLPNYIIENQSFFDKSERDVEVKGNEIEWNFGSISSEGIRLHFLTVTATLSPIEENSTKISIGVTYLKKHDLYKNNDVEKIYNILNKSKYMKIVIRKNFEELIDSTLIGRKFNWQLGGLPFHKSHQLEIDQEQKDISDELDKEGK